MTHGGSDGKIHAADGDLLVQELWEPFIGNSCQSLIGKPKLFFIQACRGNLTDGGVIFKPKVKTISHRLRDEDATDAEAFEDKRYVIPTLADLLVMLSTAEGFYSFRNPAEGSWFIQALCKELTENGHEELMTILTGVNRNVAFAKESNIPKKPELDAMKQMPNITSLLTKSFYFKTKEYKLEHA